MDISGGARVAVDARRTAAAEALRDVILDGMRDLLGHRDWSAITLTDVARAAGVSRQTIYNEFGSRQGLAQAYAMRFADALVAAVGDAMAEHEGDVSTAFTVGFHMFFTTSAADPLIVSLLSGRPQPDLLQLLTTGSGPLVTHAAGHLAATLRHGWIALDADDAGVLARAIVRLALSYVSMPPEADHDVAGDSARLLTPYAQRYGVVQTDAPTG